MRTITLCVSIGLAGGSVAQQPGELDTTFADHGILLLPDFGPVRDVLVQDDKRIIALTDQAGSAVLIGLLEDGAMDSTFGVQGLASCPIDASRILCQSDDRLVLVGGSTVSRLTPNGSLDLTYGSGGSLVTPCMQLEGAAIGPDDKVIVSGAGICITKINVDGTLDTTFSVDGYVPSSNYLYACSELIQYSRTVVIRPNWEIVVSEEEFSHELCWGTSYSRAKRTSMNADGSNPITQWNHTLSWGTQNLWDVSSAMDENGRSLEVIDVGGPEVYYRDIDGSFMFLGPTAHFQSNGPWSYSSIDPGRVVFGKTRYGFIPAREMGRFSVHRILPDVGVFDPDWGSLGRRYVDPYAGGYGGAGCVVEQAGGKLLAGGWATPILNGPEHLVLVRFHNISDPRAKLDLKLFLGGPMDINTGLMHDSLRTHGLLPSQQPYEAPNFVSVNGVGSWGMAPGVMDFNGAFTVVDWIWLELLDAADSSTVVATRVGLLHRDGQVTAANGVDPIDFSIGAGSYFLRVRHRNHLSVTVSDPIVLSDSVVSVDLSDPTTITFGVAAQKWMNGVHMLWPGDVHHDGMVRYAGAANDRDAVLVAVGGTPPTATSTGYKDADVNMDGIVKYAGAENDRDVILQSIGGAHPTAVRFEQRP